MSVAISTRIDCDCYVLATCAAVFATVLLAGCRSYSYVEPTGEDRARVRFVTTSSESVAILWAYDDEQCHGQREMMRLRNGPLVRSPEKRLGMPLWDFNQYAAKEVYMTAGRPFYGIFYTGAVSGVLTPFQETRYTVEAFQIRFEANKDYEIVLDDVQRAVHAYELETTPGGAVRKTLHLRILDNDECRHVIMMRRMGVGFL